MNVVTYTRATLPVNLITEGSEAYHGHIRSNTDISFGAGRSFRRYTMVLKNAN